MKKATVLTLFTALALGTTAFAEGRHGAKGFGHGLFDKLDANADGQVSRDEVRAKVQSHFAEVDLDKNGKISTTELENKRTAKLNEMKQHMADRMSKADSNADGKWTKAELSKMPERMFEKLDTNNDALLTRSELEAGRGERTSKHAGFMQHVLSKADTNSDGAIDSQEAQRLAEGRFDAVDKNHDGIVRRDEWKAGRHHGSKACGEHADRKADAKRDGKPTDG